MSDTIVIRKFGDLLQHGEATITNLLNGDVVRTIKPSAKGMVHLRAGDDTQLVLSEDKPVEYTPWFMDRGSLVFSMSNGQQYKLCTEMDILHAGGKSYSIHHEQGAFSPCPAKS